MCSEKPIYALACLSEISPMLPLKHPLFIWLTMVLSAFQGRSSSASSFLLVIGWTATELYWWNYPLAAKGTQSHCDMQTFLPGELGLKGLRSLGPAEVVFLTGGNGLSIRKGLASKKDWGCMLSLKAPPFRAPLCWAISFCKAARVQLKKKNAHFPNSAEVKTCTEYMHRVQE